MGNWTGNVDKKATKTGKNDFKKKGKMVERFGIKRKNQR